MSGLLWVSAYEHAGTGQAERLGTLGRGERPDGDVASAFALASVGRGRNVPPTFGEAWGSGFESVVEAAVGGGVSGIEPGHDVAVVRDVVGPLEVEAQRFAGAVENE